MTITKLHNWAISPSNGKVKLTAEEEGKTYLVHVTEIDDKGNHLTAKSGDVIYILVK